MLVSVRGGLCVRAPLAPPGDSHASAQIRAELLQERVEQGASSFRPAQVCWRARSPTPQW